MLRIIILIRIVYRVAIGRNNRGYTVPTISADKLPARIGERPVTGKEPPHLQFSDQSPLALYAEMAQWGLVDLPAQIPFIRQHATLISVPSSRALWLDESKPAEADKFMPPFGSREFAYLHADGSWHLVADAGLVEAIVDAGWGERHPWYGRGVLEVLVYAPHDRAEMQIVKRLINSAIEYASNEAIEASVA